MTDRSRRLLVGCAVTLAYAGALLWRFRGFTPRFRTHLIGFHGDTLLQHLHCAWQWRRLSEGRLGDWLDLPTMAPFSSGFVFGEPLLGITLPLLPVYLATGSSEAAFNTAVLLSYLLLGLSVFLLVRELWQSPVAGLLAVVLVVFTPWRLHYLTALNVLTVHWVVFGMWLLLRWIREPQLAALLGAALLFHVQLVTTAQIALAAIYLSCAWLFVVWLGSGCAVDRRRIVQGALALGLFLALGLPWLGFFGEAFAAAPGLLRTAEMVRYSLPFRGMAELAGVFGPLGALAAVAAIALLAPGLRAALPRGAGRTLLGLALGALLLFVVGRGPFLGPETDPTPLPGYWAARFVPFLDAVRAPIRLSSMTFLVLAALAGGVGAMLERVVRARAGNGGTAALLAAPLLLVFLWPTLPQEMVPPIEARPADLQLAAELARLPEDAVILSLPMNLEPWSAAVDERVLVHRRRQIAAFASVIPEPFRYARLALGQWPYAGADAAQALKATYAVAPIAWVERARTLLEREGYREIATAGGRVVLALPGGQAVDDHLEVAVPPVAAADRWLTLSVTSSTPRFDARGHRTLEARWEAVGEVTTAEAHAFVPGLGSAGPPVRIHVPTPHEPGRYTLTIEAKEVRVRAQVDVHPLATSLDAPIDDVTVSLAGDFALPAFVRAGEPARIDVEIAAGPEAPVLLASSRCDLPERCGEVAVEYRYTLPNRMQATATTPPRSVLSRDLVPGERRREGVYLRMPPIEGRVALDIRLRAIGREAQTGWSRLFDRIEVRRD